MSNIKNAGLKDLIKKGWNKAKSFFSGKPQEYKDIIKALKEKGYKFNPDELQFEKDGQTSFLLFANKKFIIANKSDFDNWQNQIGQISNVLKKKYSMQQEITEIIYKEFKKYLGTLQSIELKNNKILLEIK